MGNFIDRARACVVGLGYIGLPTALVLAETTGCVAGYEIDVRKREQIAKGDPPFVEGGIDLALRSALDRGALSVPDELPAAEIFIVAVPTPLGSDKTVDLTALQSAIKQLSGKLSGDELIVVESTCPPGTTESVRDWVLEFRPDLSAKVREDTLQFAYCPERVLPGRIFEEIRLNPRIVGGLTPLASTRASKLYKTFCNGEILTTTAKTAEVVKLAENAYRDVNIAFANELETISRELGINVWEVISLANHHPRVEILKPGPGVGGHCIAVDPWFLANSTEAGGYLIETARSVNGDKPKEVAQRVHDAVRAAGGDGETSVLVLGITFKENVDDVRESPAVEVVRLLASELQNTRFVVVDPLATQMPGELSIYPHLEFTREIPRDLGGFGVAVCLVGHDQFRKLTAGELANAAIIDTRGIF